MADVFKVTLRADGSADVAVCFDISGMGLAPSDSANSTTFHLDAPGAGAPAWTEATAIEAVRADAAAQKAAWVAAMQTS